MKTKHLVLISLTALLGISAMTLVDDIINRLGMEASAAQYNISSNLVGRFDTGPMDNGVSENNFRVPYAKLLPSVISGDKAGAAKELCAYIKNYINSEEFMEAYNAMKEDAMPLRDSEGRSLGTLRKDLVVIDLNIKNYPNDAAYISEQKQLRDKTEAGIAQITQASKQPFPDKELWEQTYPANPEILVKKRLQEYLALVKTVDFDAKLTAPDNYKVQKFENPAYEAKSKKWKACYRAGKEVNGVVTVFVEEWLKGEIMSAQKIKMPVAVATPAEATTASAENAVTETAVVSNTTETTNTTDTTPSPTNDSPSQQVQPKKGLMGKLKDKAKAIIKD